MDEIHESSPREIRNSTIIGKIIFSILLVSIFTVVGTSFDLHLDGNQEGDSVDKIIRIIVLLLSIILLFLYIILMYVVLIYKRKSKYQFVNYEIQYHPFYKNAKLSESIFIASAGMFGGMFFTFMSSLFGKNEENILLAIGPLFIYFSHALLLTVWWDRIKYLNSFPVEKLYKHKIRIIFGYEDYLNNKIVDNDPRVYIGQNLRVSTIEFPRNEKEKYDVKILNDNTLDRPALVTTINDANLRTAIDNGYTLEAKIVNIHEFAQLEIEFYLRNDNIKTVEIDPIFDNFQFIKIDPDYEIKF